ncbi:enoyl-CoA hydratase/isomerase family protein [Burkholderia sp. Bp9142]|uniref:enoyl-CoA hydratase/isomerase family protein n=1 Tax=Burkholderia sp. Bp9142 TaxID=2184573 RepID=UPI000F5AAA8C|nr:enoyl-CoA hydratase-related protein [Burkholderia sp. Bp9142]RQR33225.1 enoyl-CoA hydratase [Burkholderia sp. Bp9142]
MNDVGLTVTVEHAIATLTLNRPDSGNAIDLPLARALLQAAIRCDHDPAIRCVVLTGSGRFFCTGGDLGSFSEAGGDISAFLSELAGTLHLAISRLMRMEKPLLVLINGPAAGAGLSLAIAGDIVLAARSAHLTPAYGAVGLSPDGGLCWHLPRLVGMRRAQELVMLNRRVAAADAESMGLITRAVDDARLASEGGELARTLASSATKALASVRRLLVESFHGEFEAHLERESRSIASLGSGAEAREGIRAFIEKRQPDFHTGAEHG